MSRLFQYAANKVPQLARNIGGIQRPEIRSPSGNSKSFALGLISSVADKKEIPLASPRPLILRPVLLNRTLGIDNLKLTPLLREALREESYATVHGRDTAALIFVDAGEMPEAILPTGLYTITGETIKLTLNLVRNDQVIKRLAVEGQRNDLVAPDTATDCGFYRGSMAVRDGSDRAVQFQHDTDKETRTSEIACNSPNRWCPAIDGRLLLFETLQQFF